MNQNQFNTATALAGVCAALGLTLLLMGASARGLQTDLEKLQAQFQTQQEQINAGVMISQQVVPNLFKDLSSHPEDVALRALLSKHGKAPGN